MKPKKIAVLYAGARNWGGIETYIVQLFGNIDPKKIELTLVSIGSWELDEKLKSKGHRVIVVPGKWYELSKIVSLARIYKKEGFTLIVSQGMVADFFARLSSAISGVPNLITIHSDYKFDYRGYKRSLYPFFFKLFKGFTARYITVSNFLKREAIILGVPKEKITVVYNGVEEVSVKSKKPGKEVVFGSLGRLHYKKGYHLLVEAAAQLDAKYKIFIWGEGEERAYLEELIKKHDLSEKVFLKGFSNDIAGDLEKVDAYIQPSLEEGFGITVAEAMYAAKPIIVTPAGSLPELITDGKTGIIVKDFNPKNIAEAMGALIEDKALAGELGSKARQEALNRFGIKTWITEIEKVYLESAK